MCPGNLTLTRMLYKIDDDDECLCTLRFVIMVQILADDKTILEIAVFLLVFNFAYPIKL